MQATVYYRLSDAGQRDALLRGLPAQVQQSITGEITADDLDIMTISPEGNIAATTYRRFGGDWPAYTPTIDGRNSANISDLSFDSVPASIGEIITAIKARKEEKRQAFIAEELRLKAHREAEEAKEAEKRAAVQRGSSEWQDLRLAYAIINDIQVKPPTESYTFSGAFAYSLRCTLCRQEIPHSEGEHLALSRGIEVKQC